MERRVARRESVAGGRVRDVRHAMKTEDALKLAPCWLLHTWLQEAGGVMTLARRACSNNYCS